MQKNKIIYYVASSLDGLISGKNEDISAFIQEGNGVAKYMEDLQSFQSVIMGRKTYEFGYKYGLQPGQPAYPHMEHFIFSEQLQFENQSQKIHIEKLTIARVKEIQSQSKTDIYLCGGGKLAAWFLENKLIDILKIKLNPIVLGNGTKLFENLRAIYQLEFLSHETYNDGLQLISYAINYQ